MVRAVFIGDEISAAGFRLAGVHTETPDRGETSAAFTRLCKDSDLVLIAAAYAAAVAPETLNTAVRGDEPMVLVVPDIRGQATAPDMVRAADRALGIES